MMNNTTVSTVLSLIGFFFLFGNISAQSSNLYVGTGANKQFSVFQRLEFDAIRKETKEPIGVNLSLLYKTPIKLLDLPLHVGFNYSANSYDVLYPSLIFPGDIKQMTQSNRIYNVEQKQLSFQSYLGFNKNEKLDFLLGFKIGLVNFGKITDSFYQGFLDTTEVQEYDTSRTFLLSSLIRYKPISSKEFYISPGIDIATREIYLARYLYKAYLFLNLESGF